MTNTIRKQVIAGNWKMYKTGAEAVSFIETVVPLLSPSERSVYLAVPFTAIQPAANAAKGAIAIGAQNMNDSSEGAFTGEIAAKMILEAGGKFVILGHSERRTRFSESNSFINKKMLRALQDGLQPMLCIGETNEEKQAGKTVEVLQSQLESGLENISSETVAKILIAYEPVWAIGTGEPASPEQADAALETCRKIISNKWGPQAGDAISILYGGSVTAENAGLLLAKPNIDGLLVGKSSLEPEIFAKIVKA